MKQHLHMREQMVEACHGLAAKGLGATIGGHVSMRIPGEALYWTNVLDLCFEEMTVDDMVLVDFDGKVVHSDRPISPGIDFHQNIYKLRPDIHSIVHTHGFWSVAQSAFSREPKIWHNLATYFYKRTALSPDDTIEAISPVLKDNIAIIMPWHGAITLGRDLPEAAALHATFDFVCKLDVTMDGSSAEPMPPDACERMQVLLGKAKYLERTYELMCREGRKTLEQAKLDAAERTRLKARAA